MGLQKKSVQCIMQNVIFCKFFEKRLCMQRYLTALARILLAQVFLLQITMLLVGLFSNPDGYQQYQAGLASLGLPGVFAPLIILVQLVGGLALFVGFKTKFFALFMAIYAVIISFLLHLPVLQYLSIAGGLMMLYLNPVTACSLDNLKKSS
jgi:putative oxidoreductase